MKSLQILEYVGLYETYWTDVILFMKEIMVKHYKVLLDGDIPTSQSVDSSSTKVPQSFDNQEEFFLEVLRKIFERASEYPEEVWYYFVEFLIMKTIDIQNCCICPKYAVHMYWPNKLFLCCCFESLRQEKLFTDLNFALT